MPVEEPSEVGIILLVTLVSIRFLLDITRVFDIMDMLSFMYKSLK